MPLTFGDEDLLDDDEDDVSSQVLGEAQLPEPLRDFFEGLGTQGKPLSLEALRAQAIERPVSAEDIAYLLSRYPFLDVCDPKHAGETKIETWVEPQRAASGWLVFDFGHRVLMGPGRLNRGNYANGEDAGSGVGSLSSQGVDTLKEWVGVLAERWGSALHILAGTDALKRMAWMLSESKSIATNYKPTFEDEYTYDLFKKNEKAAARGAKPAPRSS